MGRSVPGRLGTHRRHMRRSRGQTRWGIPLPVQRTESWPPFTSDPVTEGPHKPSDCQLSFHRRKQGQRDKKSVRAAITVSFFLKHADCTNINGGGGLGKLSHSAPPPHHHHHPQALYKFKFAQLVNGTCSLASLSAYSKGSNKKQASVEKQRFDLRSEAERQ